MDWVFSAEMTNLASLLSDLPSIKSRLGPVETVGINELEAREALDEFF
jgi:hypothetical protein